MLKFSEKAQKISTWVKYKQIFIVNKSRSLMIQIVVCYNFRGGSRTAATSKAELFVIVINDF